MLIHHIHATPDPTDAVLDDWRRELETRRSLRAVCESRRVQMNQEWTCFHARDEYETAASSDALFHRPEDPWGLMNVANQYPHIVEQFRQES